MAEYANSRVSAFRVPDTHHSPTTRPSMNRQMAIPSIVPGPRSPEPMPLRFAITATRRSEHAADTAAFGPKQEYRPLADLLTRGAPLALRLLSARIGAVPTADCRSSALERNSHADRHGQGCPSAPTMQHSGGADLTAALHR